MPTIEVEGRTVEVDEEGFLVDHTQWSEAVARYLAEEAGIELTPRHMEVISFCRRDFADRGTPPGLRRISKVGGFPMKELYQLFPGGPGKLASKLAGLKKPTGCV